MAAKKIDSAFAIDASGSMSPCMQAVLSNIDRVVGDWQQMAFQTRLGSISAAGNEDMLMALDCALDFPFGAPSDTQRAVVLLSDEPFDGNYRFEEHGAEYAQKALRMVKKINDRHILLFTVMPDCEIADVLAASARAFKIVVSDEMQGTGLASFDFMRFFSNLGQTISATWRQMRLDKPYEKALFGQDRYAACGDLEDMEGA